MSSKVTNAFLFPSENADDPRNLKWLISPESFLTVAPWFSHMNLRPLEHDGRPAGGTQVLEYPMHYEQVYLCITTVLYG
jgi:hypothetical protein